MSTRPVLVLVLLLAIVALVSGQRMLSSDFGHVWLPTRDYYPNNPIYVFDRFGERLDLLFSAAGDERLELCMQFAHEKFLEAIRMVHINEPGHAWIAVGLHEDYLIRAARAIGVSPGSDVGVRRARYVSSLIERMKILAGIYPELPRKTRVFSLIPLVGTTLEHFDQQRSMMSDDEAAAYTESRETLRGLVKLMRDADRRALRLETSAAVKTVHL
jgi:hypothetical protein